MSEKQAKSQNNSPEVPQVTEGMTRQMAELARLELTDAEVKIFTTQLQDVLNYVGALKSVDVSGVEPMRHPFEVKTPMREDRVVPPPRDAEGRPKVLDSAPDVLNDGYKVPPIL